MTEYHFRKILSHTLNPYLLMAYPQRFAGLVTKEDEPNLDTIASVVDVSKSEQPEFDLGQMSAAQMSVFKSNALGIPMTLPLELKKDGGEWWKLPFEPLITVTGKNIIVKKQVNKGAVRGSIKERWCQDDYAITIEGVLINVARDGYPDSDVIKLRQMCEAAHLEVRCPLFEIFSINEIVVESFDFPATTGPYNQNYKISALSDDIYKLLLKGEDLSR